MDQTKMLLKRLLHSSAGLDTAPELLPDRDILTELGVDSATGMRFLIQVEKEFGFRFADTELSMSLVDDLETLADFVRQRNSEASASGENSLRR